LGELLKKTPSLTAYAVVLRVVETQTYMSMQSHGSC
jgi:hypothetical protein